MRFLDSIVSFLLGNEGENAPYRIFIEGNACYVTDVRTLKEYSKEKIIIGVKSGGIAVYGKEMYIKKYSGGDLVICGKMVKWEVI